MAYFGPQTSQYVALLEVECTPVLATPLNGFRDHYADEDSEEVTTRALDHADNVHGNMVGQ